MCDSVVTGVYGGEAVGQVLGPVSLGGEGLIVLLNHGMSKSGFVGI